MKAEMFIRGTEITCPSEYVRVQPYVSPKIAVIEPKDRKSGCKSIACDIQIREAEEC